MKAIRLFGWALLSLCYLASSAWGQQAAYQPAYPAPSPLQPSAAEPKTETYFAGISGMSDWITYKRDCCEGRHGLCTPIYSEVYLRAGPTVPVGGMTLSRELQTGWSITGGARFLLFNEPLTTAWVVDAHIINTNESGI